MEKRCEKILLICEDSGALIFRPPYQLTEGLEEADYATDFITVKCIFEHYKCTSKRCLGQFRLVTSRPHEFQGRLAKMRDLGREAVLCSS